MSLEPAIKIENVSKTFQIPQDKISSVKGAFVNVFRKKGFEKFKALDRVSLTVKKGEFFGIIGRNGSGKSTLLKILAGIYQPDQGKIQINGRISPFLELGIGFNPELSGRDNIYLNGTVLGLTKKQIREKFDSIVAFSELERFIDQKIKNYSSGMQVRLAFAVAIHANRDILLMDEVLAVGDAGFQQKCLNEFNKYRQQGRTVILVTHDMAAVEHYCDRVALLDGGKIVKVGQPNEVCDQYILQTMLPEAKESFSKRQEQGEGKLAKITKVEFLDKNNQPQKEFRPADDIRVRVYFEKDKDYAGPLNFGVALFNQEGNYLLGVNTFNDRIATEKYLQQGFFQVRYPQALLAQNNYYVKAGIWTKTEKQEVDFLERSLSFRVVSKSRNHGIVTMDYQWD